MAAGGGEFISAGINLVGRAVPFIFCGNAGSRQEESNQGEDQELKGADQIELHKRIILFFEVSVNGKGSRRGGTSSFFCRGQKADQEQEHKRDAEVESGFFKGETHILESGLHTDEDEWKGEGYVGDNDGEVSERERKKNKKDEEAHVHENFGHDHREEDKRLHESMDGEIITVEKPGAKGTEESDEAGADGSDEQAIAEGLEKDWVMEKGILPFEGEAFSNEAILRLVEGKKNEKKNKN